MARPHGHSHVDPNSPRAVGVCDRCQFLYNLEDLKWQYDWRGDQLVNLRFRVCDRCMDVPQENGRPLKLPADPLPVADPRPENYAVEENE